MKTARQFAPLAIWLALACLAAGCARSEVTPPAASAREARQKELETLVAEGRAAAARGEGVRAEQYLTLALERGGSKDVILPELLRICLENQHLRAALEHAEPYLLAHPEASALAYLVATIHLGLSQPEEARLTLARLLEREPHHANALFLAATLDQESEPARARDEFNQFLQLVPQGLRAAEARSRLARLAENSGAPLHQTESTRPLSAPPTLGPTESARELQARSTPPQAGTSRDVASLPSRSDEPLPATRTQARAPTEPSPQQRSHRAEPSEPSPSEGEPSADWFGAARADAAPANDAPGEQKP